MKIYKNGALIDVDDGGVIMSFNSNLSSPIYKGDDILIREVVGTGEKTKDLGLWSTIQDGNGDFFGTKAELITYLGTLFLDAPLGGGETNYFYVKPVDGDPLIQSSLGANEWTPFDFGDADITVNGLFVIDGNVIRYTGEEKILVFLNLSCTVFSGVPNTRVWLAQFKNAILDPGAIADVKLETNTATSVLSLATTFIVEENDYLDLQVKTDKDCNLSVYHLQSNVRMNNILID